MNFISNTVTYNNVIEFTTYLSSFNYEFEMIENEHGTGFVLGEDSTGFTGLEITSNDKFIVKSTFIPFEYLVNNNLSMKQVGGSFELIPA